MRPRQWRLFSLFTALVAGGVTIGTPWLLDPGIGPRLITGMIVAGLGYLTCYLTTYLTRYLIVGTALAVRRRVPRRAVTRARGSVAATAALGLLLTCTVPAHATEPTAWRPVAHEAGPTDASTPVPWASLGEEGQRFVAAAPTRAEIERVSGHAAEAPSRHYVGLRSAPNSAARARLAVAELERSGAFDRGTVLAVFPTGSGWVNAAAVRSMELLAEGDVATVAVQYGERPSWVEYLSGTDRARETGAALGAALRARLDELPPERRPRLLVYGESLGAIAARAAADHADRALLVGVPGGAEESPEGIALAKKPRNGATRSPVTAVSHLDDPVHWWSPTLVVHRPRGWPGAWLPIVSFWQVTGTLPGAVSAPAGHGHHYGGELVDAWRMADPDGPAGRAAPDLVNTARAWAAL